MSGPMMQQVLARLAEQEAVAAVLRAEVGALKRRRRRPRSALAATLVALMLALAPLALLAATPFTDLTGGVHDANIDAIYNTGITTGCVPNAEYCPTANVTREEMASFLARLGGLGSNPPVANARTAQTASHATIADNSTNAANASALNGKGAGDLVRVARGQSSFGGPGSAPPEHFFPPVGAVYPDFAPMDGATVTIQAPADGFVLVTAVVGFSKSTAEAPRIRLRDTTPGAPATAVSRVAMHYVNINQIAELALTWVFPVTGAGTKIFTLEVAQQNSDPDDVTFSNDVLTALYVPFGYDGGTTLGP